MVFFFKLGWKRSISDFKKKEFVIVEENVDNNEYCIKDDIKKIFGLKFS